MKVTIIRPPVLVPSKRLSANPVSVIPPLGLAYIAGVLRQAGHEVTCIDASGEAIERVRLLPGESSILEIGLTHDEIIERIPKDTEVVGVSSMFSAEWFSHIDLIKKLRKSFPTAAIALGGEHATAEYEYILSTLEEVDFCVLGEGEYKFLDLLNYLANKSTPIPPYIAYRDNQTGKIFLEKEQKQYRNKKIDSVPWPAWDLFPLEKYFAARWGFSSYGHKSMPMLASRGCPYQCTFCSSPGMWTTRWTARNVDDVLSEIIFYKNKYGINRVEFYDLTSIVNGNWVRDFSRKLIDQKLNITWASPAGTRTEAFSSETLSLMRQSGCTKLIFAIESSSPETLKRIKKGLNLEKCLRSMKDAIEQGLIIKVNMILGFPFQRKRDIMKEILFAIRLAWIGANDVAYYNFTPYPGSELHEQIVRENKIVKDDSYVMHLKGFFPGHYTNPSWNQELSSTFINFACLFGMALFYLVQFTIRPHRLVMVFTRIILKRPQTMVELGIFTYVKRILKLWSNKRPANAGQC